MSKPNKLLDAVKTAKSIHQGDYSSLRDKSFLIIDNSDKIKKKRQDKDVKKSGPKLTLADLVKKIDNLGNDLRNEMNAGFKQVNTRIDNLEKDINTRLDYIVKANNLKDSK